MNAESTSSRAGRGAAGDQPGEHERGAPPLPQPGETLVSDAVSLLESVVEYLSSIFRLEQHRFERRAHQFARRAAILVSGAAVLLLGVVFLSVGVSSLLSEALQVPYAGPLIVGGVYALGGLVALLVLARKKES